MVSKAGRVFLLFAACNIAQAQESCLTPKSESGNCIVLTQCQSLMSALNSATNKAEVFEYLKTIQCGFEDSNPKVCCAQQNSGSTVSPPVSNPPSGSSGIDLLPTECGRDYSGRIIGGKVAEIDEFPWLALIEYQTPNGTRLSCGGALINKRYILTAAHCVKDLKNDAVLRSVRLGEYNIQTNPDCIDSICADKILNIAVEQQIVHESYNSLSRDRRQDIALLRLARDVNPTKYIKPICLPTSSNVASQADVAGWGTTGNGIINSDIKLKLKVPIVNRDECQKIYTKSKVILGEDQLCAGGIFREDSCNGDSGSPLMQQVRASDGIGRWTAVGLVSFGPRACGMDGIPSVYTKVHNFVPWIISKLRP